MVAHVCDPNTWEAEAGGCCECAAQSDISVFLDTMEDTPPSENRLLLFRHCCLKIRSRPCSVYVFVMYIHSMYGIDYLQACLLFRHDSFS